MTPSKRSIITPCRSYNFKQVAGGEFATITVWPREEDFEKLTNSEDVITADEILVWAKNLRFQLDETSVHVLVKGLNLMRVTAHANDAVPFHLEKATRSVEIYVAGLCKELPMLIKVGRDMNTQTSNGVADAYESFLRVVRLVNQVVAHTSSGKRSAPWHGDAAYLGSL